MSPLQANWSSMFKAFTGIPVSDNTRQALFESWRQYIIKSAKPKVYYQYYTTAKTVDTWWLHWLLDNIVTPEKGATWFQQQITQWLDNLSGDKRDLGEEYDILRLLTKDLAEIHYQGKPPYPKFYQVVIRPKDLSAPDDTSRRTYLQQYAPTDLWEKVITYWKTHLKNFVPKPEDSQGSDYTQHAQWMTALLELAPDDYNNLLRDWKVNLG